LAEDFLMNYRNPIFTENGCIDCEIEHLRYGWMPFTCDPNDTNAQFDTAALFVEMQPHAAPFVPPPALTDEEVAAALAQEVRAERNRLLTASDWTQVADAPVDPAAWAAYRQTLRDIPQQAGFPRDVAWPAKP
jgi:hypothetical protein